MNVEINVSIQEAETRKSFTCKKQPAKIQKDGKLWGQEEALSLLQVNTESSFLRGHPNHDGDQRLSHNTNVIHASSHYLLYLHSTCWSSKKKPPFILSQSAFANFILVGFQKYLCEERCLSMLLWKKMCSTWKLCCETFSLSAEMNFTASSLLCRGVEVLKRGLLLSGGTAVEL